MSSIVIVTDRQGRRYAYRSTSYWDKEKRAPRTHKEYIGRVDDDGNIIPKKVAPANTEESTKAPVQSSYSMPDTVALLKQINSKLEKIEAAIAVMSDAWKSIDSIFNSK